MLLGIAFGGATSLLLDFIFRDPTVTVVVTLVSAYSSYYTAERLVGASGLLAVVCNGFAMSLLGARAWPAPAPWGVAGAPGVCKGARERLGLGVAQGARACGWVA